MHSHQRAYNECCIRFENEISQVLCQSRHAGSLAVTKDFAELLQQQIADSHKVQRVQHDA